MTEVNHVVVATGDNITPSEQLMDSDFRVLQQQHGEKVRIYATEDDQWMYLTGKPKDGNALGAYPFLLLCAVSRSRERGLTTVEMAKETGQDPRSIHGRVNKLMEFGLVQRFPVVHDGMSTHLTVYKKYVKENREAANPGSHSTGVDMGALRRSIVRLVKEGAGGKAGIRQHDDLKKQLKFDTSSRSHIIFSQCVRRLENQGYVKRVISQPAGSLESYKCIKFINDLPEDREEDDDDDEYAVELMAEVNNGGGEDGEETIAHIQNQQNHQQQQQQQMNIVDLNDENIKEEEQDYTPERNVVLQSLHYPFESQVYAMIECAGTRGMPAMELSEKMVGRPYRRIFSRILDLLVDKDAKKAKGQPPHLGHYDLLRGTDNEGRVKYYRYFTQKTYRQLRRQEPDPLWGTFGPQNFKNSFKNLADMERASSSQIPGVVEVRQENGHLVPLFHGEKARTSADATLVLGGGGGGSGGAQRSSATSTPAKKTKVGSVAASTSGTPSTAGTTTGKKRGRPRKRPLTEDEGTPSTTPKKRSTRKKRATAAAEPEAEPETETPSQQQQNEPIRQDLEPQAELQPIQSEAIQEQLQPLGSSMPLAQNEQAQLVDPNAPLLAPSANVEAMPVVDIKDNPLLATPTAPSTEPEAMQVDSKLQDIGQVDNNQNNNIAPEIIAQDAEDAEKNNSNLSEQAQRALNTPRYKRPGKAHLYKAIDVELEFSSNKREEQIMDIVRDQGGIVAAGAAFNRKLNDYAQTATVIDRKTVERHVEHLVNAGRLRKIHVTFPNTRGIHITKSIYALPDADDNSELMKNVKDEIRSGIEKPQKFYVASKKLEKEIHETGFVYDEIEARFIRGSERRHRGGTRGKKTNAAERRLAAADATRRGRRKIKQEREEDDDDEEEEGSEENETPVKRRKNKRTNRTKNGIPDAIRNGQPPGTVAGYSQLPYVQPLNYAPIMPAPLPDGSQPELPPYYNLPPMPAEVEYNPPKEEENEGDSSTKKQKRRRNKRGVIDQIGKSRTPRAKKEARRNPVTGKMTRARQKKWEDMDPELFYRLIVVVRSLYANSTGGVNWEAVGKALPSIMGEELESVTAAKSKWVKIRDRFGGPSQIPKATRRFEKMFLKAYRDGVFPIVTDPEHYDVASYAIWWKENDSQLIEATIPWLAETRQGVEKDFDIQHSNQSSTDTMDAMYIAPSMTKVEEVQCFHSFAIERKFEEEKGGEEEDITEIKQAIKALIVTPDEDYDAAQAQNMLEKFEVDRVEIAVKRLEKEEKSLVYASKDRANMGPGRNFMLSDRAATRLKTMYNENLLEDATKFEDELRTAINQEQGLVMSRMAPDSTIVSALEFFSMELIKLVRVNEEHLESIFGNRYVARHVDRESLDCDIVWKSNGEQIDEVKRESIAIPVAKKPCGNVFTGVTGKLSKPIWEKVIKRIIWLIVQRPSIPFSYIFKKLDFFLTKEELQQSIDWLTQRDIVQYDKNMQGYRVKERWYSHVFD